MTFASAFALALAFAFAFTLTLTFTFTYDVCVGLKTDVTQIKLHVFGLCQQSTQSCSQDVSVAHTVEIGTARQWTVACRGSACDVVFIWCGISGVSQHGTFDRYTGSCSSVRHCRQVRVAISTSSCGCFPDDMTVVATRL